MSWREKEESVGPESHKRALGRELRDGVLKYLHSKKVIYAVNSKSQTLRSGGFPFSGDLEENLAGYARTWCNTSCITVSMRSLVYGFMR